MGIKACKGNRAGFLQQTAQNHFAESDLVKMPCK
jgi:hypothetical protein